jgi:hypothetical protein
MGHRTLLAYDRDGYDLHDAHWGVDPAAFTPLTPFGGRPDAGRFRTVSAAGIAPGEGHLTDGSDPSVDPDPVGTVDTFDEVVAHVDPIEHEALHVVPPDFEIRRYLVAALGRNAEVRRTALLRYRDDADARYLRGWLAGARAVRDVGAPASGPSVTAALRVLAPERGTVVFPRRRSATRVCGRRW